MSRRKNSFSKALGHLKSTKIDEKLEVLNEVPTNSTSGLYTIVPGAITRTDNLGQIPDHSTIDWDIDGGDGKDTTGLFDGAGNHKFISPPGDNSYILGPMSSMYYTYASPNVWTMIGYIRESDRRMVNLGDIDGTLEDWDGVSNFTSYGQLTIEQARWFKDTAKKPDGYRAFYPGPPSSTPDAFGRYYCTITGTPLAQKDDLRDRAPIDLQASDILSAIMDRKSKGIPLSKAEKDFLDKQGKLDQIDKKSPISKAIDAIKKFFGDYVNPPAAEYSANIAKSILQNKPINVNQDDIPQGDIDKLLKNLANNIYASPLTVSQGNPTPYADDNIYIDANGNVQSNIGPNGETGYYKKNQTGDMGGGKGIAGYGNPLAAAGQAQVQVVYPTDGSEPYFLYTDHAYHNVKSTDPGEVPDPIKQGLSWVVHNLAGKGDANKPNTGEMSGYPSNIKGDVKTQIKLPLSQVPKEIQDRAKFENHYQNLVKQGKAQPITNQYTDKGRVLSESRRSRILKTLKDPVVIPETKQKSYKVDPGRRYKKDKTNFQGMDKLVGDVTPQKSFKKPQDLWSDGWQGHNARVSQDKKNIVLEKIGQGKQAWNYMLNHSQVMNADQLEDFWGKNPDFYSYFFGGKKYRPIRKEQVKGDYVVFLVDEAGVNSSMLQSQLNMKLAEEEEKKMLAEYNKIEPISYEKDPLFKKVSKVLKSKVDYPEKPAKKGYPNEPPPKLGPDGFHPDFGKKYKYDKLDPVSAIAMKNAPTGDPEIDANVEKASKKSKVKVKEQYSNWKQELKEKEELKEWSPVASTRPTNSTSQTFQHVSGTTATFAGLGGVEVHPSNVTIDGDDVPTPTYSDLPLAGYTKPLGMRRRSDYEDVNPRLDASQEFAQKVNSDVMMNARVSSNNLTDKIIKSLTKKAYNFIKNLPVNRFNQELKVLFGYLSGNMKGNITNNFIDKAHLQSLFKGAYLTPDGRVDMDDFIVGTGQKLTFNPKTGTWGVSFNYDFEKNIIEAQKSKINWLMRTLGPIIGGEYAFDAGMFGHMVAWAKSQGYGQNIQGEFTFDSEQLSKLNPKLIEQHMRNAFGINFGSRVWSKGLMVNAAMKGTPMGTTSMLNAVHNYYTITGNLPPTSVVKGSIPHNYGDHPEYDPAVIARIDRIKKAQAVTLKPSTEPDTYDWRKDVVIKKKKVRSSHSL